MIIIRVKLVSFHKLLGNVENMDNNYGYDYEKKYEKLKSEYENYQSNTEEILQELSIKNTLLEKKMDVLSSIVEISTYINSMVSDENLIAMINDMIIGILGVTYSSICILEGDKLVIKASNVPNASEKMFDALGINDIEKGEPIVINSLEALLYNERDRVSIHSIIGIPVYIGEIYRGYIIVEHSLYDFFNSEHMTYITAIANQIGIALENNFLYKKLRETAIKDPLLSIYNRRHFFELVESKVKRNPQRNFAIVMIDLDNFKRINDVYGHQVGDAVLIQTCKIIVDSVNKEDIVARYGGEEIVLYINNVQSHEEIFGKINNIRMKIFEDCLESNGNKVNYSASFGIGYYEEEIRDLNKVLNVADTMLYNAKTWGKNMVVSA